MVANVTDGVASRKSGGRRGPLPRKEQRRAARVQKRHKPVTPRAHRPNLVPGNKKSKSSSDDEEEEEELLPTKLERRTAQAPKATAMQLLKSSQTSPEESEVSNRPKISRGVKDRLAADDAEIEALERALGVKSKSKLPKAFEDEGLGDLLKGIDEASGDASSKKRTRSDEGDEWLKAKRRKAHGVNYRSSSPLGNGGDGDANRSDSDEAMSDVSLSEDERTEESFVGFDDEDAPVETGMPKKRENPYVAPSVPNADFNGGKYIPPSLRKSNVLNGDDLSQLRRQIQGLLNKLSDANLLAILADLEKLYQNHPRQHVSAALIELLCNLIFDPSALQDTFLILHSGFASAVFKSIGTDFGAQMIQQCVTRFDSLYSASKEEGGVEKRLRNMTAFLAYLYCFQVVGSNLIYDFIRLFLGNISENNTELLLKIMQSRRKTPLASFHYIADYLRCWSSTPSG